MKTIDSTFDKGKQGWTMQGDVQSFMQQDGGGNPGGFLHWIDAAAGQDAYYIAPTAFLGDKHAFYGGALSYDIEDTGKGYQADHDVEIDGANGQKLFATLGQPDATWTHFSISLEQGAGWHVGTPSGDAATKADIKGVLSDISAMFIRAEYVDGPENGGLDNVVFAKTVPPAAAFSSDGMHLDAHPAFAMTAHALEHLAIA